MYFFSSDGQWIGFYAYQDGTLKKIAVTGGAAVTLCKAQAPNGISWSGDQIVFSQPKGIMRVSANGGEPELLAASASSQESMSDPQLLNDGTALLFTVTKESGASRWDKADIVAQSVKSGERKVLVHGGSTVRYIPTGHLVYALSGTLFAVRFDAKTLQVKGGPVPILEGVSRGAVPQTLSGAAQFSFSNTGSLIYIPGPVGGAAAALPPRMLALADRNGKVKPLGVPPQSIYHPRISPDGKQLVFGTDDGNEGIIWVYDLKGNGPARRLTFGGSNLNPIWSRDGRYITFASEREGDRGLFRQLADGTAPAERLTKAELGPSQRPEQWSPDGKTLSFIMNHTDQGGGGSDLFTLTLEGERKPQPLVLSPSNKRYSAFSPDGRWFAYASGEITGFPFNIFVEPFPPTGARYQLTSMGGRDPVWSPDGKELFFNTQVQSNGRLVSVDVRTQSGFTFDQPKEISIPGAILGGNGRNYDITPDGRQFVVVVPPADAPGESQTRRAPQQINVVLNWFTELQQRVPVK